MAMHWQQEFLFTKNRRPSHQENPALGAAANHINLLNVLMPARPGASHALIVTPKTTSPMFADNQKSQNQSTL